MHENVLKILEEEHDKITYLFTQSVSRLVLEQPKLASYTVSVKYISRLRILATYLVQKMC